MGKKVQFISKIQEAFNLITNGVGDLNELAYFCEHDDELRDKLLAYVVQYAKLNYDLSTYLIIKLTEAIPDDKDSDDFDNLMKDFE